RLSEAEVDAVLLIGGTSKIPLLQHEMELRFGAAICDLSNAQTIIAEGAAVIGFHGFQPFLAHPVRLMLSGGSSLPVFDRDTVMPAEAHKETTLFCTDNRDGEARLIMAEQTDSLNQNSLVHKTVIGVPVESALPRPYQHERIVVHFDLDEN